MAKKSSKKSLDFDQRLSDWDEKFSKLKHVSDFREKRDQPEFIYDIGEELSNSTNRDQVSFQGDKHQLAVLLEAIEKHDISIWNNWRQKPSNYGRVDLRGVDLSNCDLYNADLYSANLSEAKLNYANLKNANLNGANLDDASLVGAELTSALINNASMVFVRAWGANFSYASINKSDLTEARLFNSRFYNSYIKESCLRGADLRGVVLRLTELTDCNLRGANLSRASLIESDITGSDFTDARIHGISVWDIIQNDFFYDDKKTVLKDLVVTPRGEPDITVDDLEVAQFIYLLLHNERIRNVIDTIGKKTILILGRFTPERKPILNAIRQELRGRNYIPILFDFEKPASRSLTETISTLAHMSRFIIADITDAKSIPQELQAIVPNLPSVAVQPILQRSETEYGMFEHFKKYPWVLPLYRYESREDLLESLSKRILKRVEAKARHLHTPA